MALLRAQFLTLQSFRFEADRSLDESLQSPRYDLPLEGNDDAPGTYLDWGVGTKIKFRKEIDHSIKISFMVQKLRYWVWTPFIDCGDQSHRRVDGDDEAL